MNASLQKKGDGGRRLKAHAVGSESLKQDLKPGITHNCRTVKQRRI